MHASCHGAQGLVFVLHDKTDMLGNSAAWHGARIIMRQVSEEAIGIFDFTMELYNSCSGDWAQLAKRAEVDATNIEEFITYAATFLSNVGNYYVLRHASSYRAFSDFLTA